MAKLSEDEATTKAHTSDLVAIGGRTCSRDTTSEVLGVKLDMLSKNIEERIRIPLGTYRGLCFGMVLHPHFSPDV